MDTPELDKMTKAKETSQELGEFLEWLRGEYTLCQYGDCSDIEDELYQTSDTTEYILSKYYGIDLQKVEEEKRLILESFVKNNV